MNEHINGQPERAFEWKSFCEQDLQKTAEGFDWTETCDGIAITGYSAEENRLIIPEQIDGKPVTQISEEAFLYQDLEEVLLPACLKRIRARAFAFCTGLTAITLPAGLEYLDGTCFLCTDIESLSLPNGLKEIPSPHSLDMHLFTDPSALNFYADGNGLYQKNADGSLKLLTTFTKEESFYIVHKDTTTIGSSAFENIHSIITLTLPAGLEFIEGRALQPLYTKENHDFSCRIIIHPDNPVFYIDKNGLWQKTDDGLRLVRWTGSVDASLSDDVKKLHPYSMAEYTFENLRLSSDCLAEPGAFLHAYVKVLDLGGPLLLPEGVVQNSTFLSAVFSSGKADLSAYDGLLLAGYLSAHRIKMILLRLRHPMLSESGRKKLTDRLLSESAITADLLAKAADARSFSDWLALPGQTKETLADAKDILTSYHGANLSCAREMLAALLVKKSSLETKDDEFAL